MNNDANNTTSTAKQKAPRMMQKAPIIIVLLLLIGGTAYYFGSGAYKTMSSPDTGIWEGIRMKAAYSPEGSIKLFATQKNTVLLQYKAQEGKSSTAKNAMVIGSAEAAMMREEKLFTNIGDEIKGLFGIDARVGGILLPTNTIIDDMHFVSSEQFAALQGTEEVVFVKFTAEGMPKIFYQLPIEAKNPLTLQLAQGDINDYKITAKEGVTYQPVIIGAKEAAMMQEEKLFEATGDTIQGFFGQDIIVVGIVKETNTAIDMMHITPLSAQSLA